MNPVTQRTRFGMLTFFCTLALGCVSLAVLVEPWRPNTMTHARFLFLLAFAIALLTVQAYWIWRYDDETVGGWVLMAFTTLAVFLNGILSFRNVASHVIITQYITGEHMVVFFSSLAVAAVLLAVAVSACKALHILNITFLSLAYHVSAMLLMALTDGYVVLRLKGDF